MPNDPASPPTRRSVAKAAAAAGLAALFGAATTTRAHAATRIGPRTLDPAVPSAALDRSAPVR